MEQRYHASTPHLRGSLINEVVESGDAPPRHRQHESAPLLATHRTILQEDELDSAMLYSQIWITRQAKPSVLGLSATQASLTLAKAIFGAASFTLPYAFGASGYALSLIGIIFLGLCSTFTVDVILRCVPRVCEDVDERRRLTYPQLVQGAFVASPLLASALSWLLYASIVITSLGACAVYVLFSATLLKEVVGASVSVLVLKLLIGALVLSLALLPNFHYLAVTSFIGDLAVVVAFVVVALYAILVQDTSAHGGEGEHFGPHDSSAFEFSQIGVFVGNAFFLFSIHMIALPTLVKLRATASSTATIVRTFGISTFVNVGVGLLGFFAFASPQQIILSNMTQRFYHLPDLARVMLVFDLLFTYPVVLAAGRDIIEHSLVNEQWKEGYFVRTLIRFLMVALTVVVAVYVTKISDLMGLVSGSALVYMGFILPAVLYIQVLMRREFCVSSVVGGSLSFVVIGVGVAAAYLTTKSAIESVIIDYKH